MKTSPKIKVTFGLVTGPDRANWPKHGAFLFRRIGRPDVVGVPIFSITVARAAITEQLNDGVLDQADALILTSKIDALGLPMQETRYDALVTTALRHRADDKDALNMYHRLINVVCGDVPPEENSGEARFEICRNGEFCDMYHCHLYPPHGAIFYTNFGKDLQSHSLFTPESVRHVNEISVRQGLLTQEEADRIKDADLSQLIVNEKTQRAEKILRSFTSPEASILLNVVFGITKPFKSPIFKKCLGHYHLHTPILEALGDQRNIFTDLINLFRVETVEPHSVALYNENEALGHLRKLFDIGVLSLEETTRLRADAELIFSPTDNDAVQPDRPVASEDAAPASGGCMSDEA